MEHFSVVMLIITPFMFCGGVAIGVAIGVRQYSDRWHSYYGTKLLPDGTHYTGAMMRRRNPATAKWEYRAITDSDVRREAEAIAA